MPRIARLVVPGIPHHVTQRGNRRQPVFFSSSDYRLYARLLAESCGRAGTGVWGWCLMPNHVHLILLPADEDGLRAALGETHRRYTSHVNLREDWRGHLWQCRFASFPMDEAHLLACARYVELNPVRAGLVDRPEHWPWSSARAHLFGQADGLTDRRPLLARMPDWRGLLDCGLTDSERDAIRLREKTGYPLGGPDFAAALAAKLGRAVTPRPPGRPKKTRDSI
jgi:REP-associated tyrosine transposase